MAGITDFLGPAGAVLGGLADVGKFITGLGQKKAANKINPVWQQYQTSPFASQQLATAQNAYNDPSMGTRGQVERGFQSAGANFNNQVDRSATSGSQTLALAAAGQGQTDNSISNENLDFMKNKTNLLGNLNNAYATNINEGDKVYQSQLQKYMMDTQQKQALLGAGAENKFGAVGDAASLLLKAGQVWGRGNKKPPPPPNDVVSNGPGTSWMGSSATNVGDPQGGNWYVSPQYTPTIPVNK